MRRTMTVALLTVLLSGTGGAWKPSTHLAVAEQALADALDDGRITIPELANDQIVGLRTYPVDPTLLQDLQTHAAQYRAGVIGPDAYPDMLTGQQMIHPGDIEEASPSPQKVGDSDAWLQHLFQSSRTQGSAARAFTAGFLTHAAGDMFGHSLVNTYTGGHFALGGNALQHLVLEGYIGKRTPNIVRVGGGGSLVNRNDVSIGGAEDFIYRYLIDAKSSTALTALYDKNDSLLSIPAIFSRKRARLQADIDAYYARKAQLIQQYNSCSIWNFRCSRTAIAAQLASYMAANAWKITYKEHWRADIDSGLRAWPQVSSDLSGALIFTTVNGDLTQGGMDLTRARQVLGTFVTDHLLSMMGLPDLVGKVAGFDLLPPLELAFVRDFIQDQLNTLVVKSTGIGLNDWQTRMTSPEQYFDNTMALSGGQPLSLTQMNQKLGLSDAGYNNSAERFDLSAYAPTYNTLILSKLVMLNQATFGQVLMDLGSPVPPGLSGNPALGFIHNFDGDHQWNAVSGPGHVNWLENNCGLFNKIFKSQEGGACANTTPLSSACPDILASGATMNINDVRTSCDGQNVLILQGDNNLVLYRNNVAVWASHTWQSGASRLMMGDDGHLALYDASNNRRWTAGTWNHRGAYLKVQNDGHAVVYEPGTGPNGTEKMIWSTP